MILEVSSRTEWGFRERFMLKSMGFEGISTEFGFVLLVFPFFCGLKYPLSFSHLVVCVWVNPVLLNVQTQVFVTSFDFTNLFICLDSNIFAFLASFICTCHDFVHPLHVEGEDVEHWLFDYRLDSFGFLRLWQPLYQN